jgi:hypothetical protein
VIEFLAANWLWIALVVFFVAMHRSGHGCGMHGNHGGHAGHAGHTDEAGQTGHQHTDHNRPAERADGDHAHHAGGGRSTS